MPSTPLLIVHVSAATVGLLSGFLSMFLRKGSSRHRIAGNIFFVSMLIMTVSAGVVAGFLRPNGGNLMGATLTFYLVVTAWVAARRRERVTWAIDKIALLYAIAVGVLGFTFAYQAVHAPRGMKDGYPPALYIIFGTITLLFASSDVRMIMRGGVAGAQRIARHLFRMCIALLIAALSFYPGQAKLFSRAVRQTNLLFIPVIVLIGMTAFWMVRVLRTRKKGESVVAVYTESGG